VIPPESVWEAKICIALEKTAKYAFESVEHLRARLRNDDGLYSLKPMIMIRYPR
jgi:hypothetical protein